MRFITLELMAILRDVGIALHDVATRSKGRRYEHTIRVRAPREVVWAVASARNTTLDGSPPIVIKALPSPERGVEVLQVRTGSLTYRIGLRQLERREGVSEIHAVVPEHTDHLALMTGVTTSGFALMDALEGARLTMFQEGARMRFGARISTPMALRLMGRRIAAASEQAEAMRRSHATAGPPRTRASA
jgi:hypothetical protein